MSTEYLAIGTYFVSGALLLMTAMIASLLITSHLPLGL